MVERTAKAKELEGCERVVDDALAEKLSIGRGFYDYFRSLNAHWRLCLMQSGRYGWVREQAQVGDEIFIMYGAKVPFLFRPIEVDNPFARDGRHYTMISTAYVQGVMDGEAIKGMRKNGYKETVIYLH